MCSLRHKLERIFHTRSHLSTCLWWVWYLAHISYTALFTSRIFEVLSHSGRGKYSTWEIGIFIWKGTIQCCYHFRAIKFCPDPLYVSLQPKIITISGSYYCFFLFIEIVLICRTYDLSIKLWNTLYIHNTFLHAASKLALTRRITFIHFPKNTGIRHGERARPLLCTWIFMWAKPYLSWNSMMSHISGLIIWGEAALPFSRFEILTLPISKWHNVIQAIMPIQPHYLP